MSSLERVRLQGSRQRLALGFQPQEPVPATQILETLQLQTGVQRYPVAADDPLLGGAQAVLNLSVDAIVQDSSLPATAQNFDAAHEYAHLYLHRASANCSAIDLDDPGLEINNVGISQLDGYSPRQKREVEANVYATELLLPRPLARSMFAQGCGAHEISDQIGIPVRLARRQLVDAILLPEDDPAAFEQPRIALTLLDLDPSQHAAATLFSGPLLLGAGPGTGKTRTLVARCLFLIENERVPAERILALTYSRRAAGEMQERLAQAGVGVDGGGVWVGTFHSFGLDILRRFGERVGIAPGVRLLDRMDAVALLEDHLLELGLVELANLASPAIHLRGVLGQISRAKDELCGPHRYGELASAMLESALLEAEQGAEGKGKRTKKDEAEGERHLSRAHRAVETASVYKVYERLMREGGYLDYSDLIFRAVEMLESCPDICVQLRREFPHILADEYQDVNRASARLLKLLAGDHASGLWVVGDHRQSIYQFQGASPANVAAFQRDYPSGQRLELEVNYRSRQPIVDLFGAAADSLAFCGTPRERPAWRAARGVAEEISHPGVTIAEAETEAAQADGIATLILQMKATGYSYRDQAILCRTHVQAAALADHLDRLQIPVLYMGELLERPEVKDMLCLLTLCSTWESSAFVRVATLPEYGVGLAEAAGAAAHLQSTGIGLAELLRQPSAPFSDAARAGFQLLTQHLAQVKEHVAEPVTVLQSYLFEISAYLAHLTTPEEFPFKHMQQLMALHEFIHMAEDFTARTPRGEQSLTDGFIRRIRRMAELGESGRSVATAGHDQLDAVRLMTVHGAKGLEFPVVFVPNLSYGQFPPRGRYDGFVEPPGLSETADEESDEEQCLFFVALSRARDHLILSRALVSRSGREVMPSPLLKSIEHDLGAGGSRTVHWADTRNADDGLEFYDDGQEGHKATYSESELDQYERCPRQYYYARELDLQSLTPDDGYLRFHRTVMALLDWKIEAQRTGEEPSSSETEAKLADIWQQQGPVGHLHEEMYLDTARSLAAATSKLPLSARTNIRLVAELTLCSVRVRPDALVVDHDKKQVTAMKIILRSPAENDHTAKDLSLLRQSVKNSYPDWQQNVALYYLEDGTVQDVPPSPRYEPARLAKYERAALGIQNKHYEADPQSSDECNRCPFLFLCPQK